MRAHPKPVAGHEPAPIDRPWRTTWLTVLVGPLVGVSAVHVDHRYEQMRAGLPRSSWLRAHPAPVARDVAGDVLQEARAIAAIDDLRPVRVLIGDAGAAVVLNHAVGDREVVCRLVVAPLGDGRPADAVAGTRSASLCRVALGAARYWSPRPRALVAAFQGVRRRSRGTVAVAERRRGLLTRVLDDRAMARLRVLRDDTLPGGSVSLLLMSRFLDELSRRDVAVDDVALAVNLRRYLPSDPRLLGNLVAVLHLPVDATAPQRSALLRTALATGQPLAQFLLALARATLTRPGGSAPGPEPAPVLGWSDHGEMPGWDRLPWGPGARTVVFEPSPLLGRRIGVHLVRLDGAVHVSCTFNAAVFDAEVMAAALDATVGAVAAPVGTERLAEHGSAVVDIEQHGGVSDRVGLR